MRSTTGMLAAQRLERVGVGAPPGLGLAPAGKPEVVVEETSELLRAAGVERVPGDLLHLALDLGDARVHLGADGPSRSQSTATPSTSMAARMGTSGSSMVSCSRVALARSMSRTSVVADRIDQADPDAVVRGGLLHRHIRDAALATPAAEQRLLGLDARATQGRARAPAASEP